MELFGGFEFGFWDRRQSQAGAVSVGTNNLEPSVWGFEVFSNIEGHKSGIVSGEEVLGAFLEFPVGGFAKFLVAFWGELISAPVDNVEGWSGGVDKI